MKVSASILNCDFTHLADQFALMEQAGVDMIHLDVMDGVFVPNLSFGPPVIASVRPLTALPFDTHLMVQYPDRLIEAAAKAGSDYIGIHSECDSPIGETLDAIHALGKKTVLTVKPHTPAEAVFPYLDRLDMVLVMTVEPGFGGQSFMADMMPKVTAICEEIRHRGLSIEVEVDGGVAEATAPVAAAAGATVAVVGSALFRSSNPKALVDTVHQAK